MSMTDKFQFENGDWVQGKSLDGELIHGYIETVDSIKGIVKVNVVESDNEKAIGKSIWIPNKGAKKLQELTVSNEAEILSLIDLALLTKDEQWFRELSSKLSSIKNITEVSTKKSEFLITRNRIENLDVNR